MENFSVGDSLQLNRASLSFKATPEALIPMCNIQFKRIVNKVLRKLQGDFLKNLRNYVLDNEQIMQGFHDQVNPTALYSFRLMCKAISDVKKLRVLDLSGCNINAHFAIELSDAIKQNTSLHFLSLANCNLSSFSLSCIFQALSHNLSLTILNLMNNQGFNQDAVEDFCEYVLKGKTNLSQIVLTHCNIDNYLLSIIFRNIHHLKSLKYLKVNLMSLNSEGLLGLRSLLVSFNATQQLDFLDLSYNYIKNEGIILLNDSLALNFQIINILELDLSRNGFSQLTNWAINALESLVLKFKNLKILNVSLNSIREFTNPKFLDMNLQKMNLSRNQFSELPMNFLQNVQYVDLSMNQIRVKGAYHISQILSRVKTQWQVLNLNDNMIMPEGFISIIYALSKFNKTLSSLSVANNMLDGHAILYYAANHSLLSLRSIDISRNHFRYQLVYALLNMIKDCPLSYIDFSKIKYQRDELEFIDDTKLLFEIKSFNVRFIDFSYNPLMITSILRSLSHSYVRLESVNFSHCDIVKNNSIALFNKFLSRSQNLQNLNLAGNQLGSLKGECLKSFVFRIGQCISLQYLNLQHNQIRQNLKMILLSLKSLPNLYELDLSSNLIQDSQYLSLLGFFQISHIQIINLSRNYLSMQSLDAIYLAFYKNCSVQVINLSHNRLNGQHLLSLEKIIEKDQLRVLDLSSNNQLEKLKSFFYTRNIPVIHSLTLNNLQFNQRNFNIFLQSIHENKRQIQSIDIENTLLQSKQLKLFLMSICCTKQLKTLALQYVSFNDISITLYMREHLMPTLNRLIRLGLVSCIICDQMWNILCLQELDLSGNFFNDNNLLFGAAIIIGTQSIKHLILQNCNINDINIQQLVVALGQNYSLESLDLSFNSLSYIGIRQILNIRHVSKQVNLTSIILSGCLLDDYQESVLAKSQFIEINQTKQYIKSLNLSENRFNSKVFMRLLETISDRQIFPNIKSLNLSKSNLNDRDCESIATLLKHSHITELNLANNQISDWGLQIVLFSLEQQHAKLKFINFEKNQISRKVFKNLLHIKLHSLKVLILAFNFTLLTSEYSAAFVQIYKNNPNLFIYNLWNAITEELAYLIIISYINLYNENRVKSLSVPNYLRVLKIENSDISDEFCVYFGSQYFYFPFLETLSFSSSPRITKYGKIYLYLTLFQECYQDFDLKHFYFNEERNFSTVFDDGVWNYLLINIKFWLQCSKKDSTENSRSKYEEIIAPMQEEQGRLGLVGKIIINLINKVLQNDDQHFTFSSNFIKYMTQNQLQIKIFALMQSILRIALVGVSAIVFIGILSPSIWPQMYPIYKKICDQQLTEGWKVCYLDSGSNRISLLYSTAVAILSISILLSSIDIFVAIQVRKKANPDYKILSPQTNTYLKRNIPHLGELKLFCFTIFDQMSYFFAFNQIFSSYQITLTAQLIQKDYINDLPYKKFLQDISVRNLNSMYILIVVISFKFFYQFLNQFIALKQIFETHPNTQRVDYLNSFWRKNIHDHNYVLNSFLSHFCPQSGQKIFKAYFTQHQIIEFVQGFFIELPQLILSLIYVYDMQSFLKSQLGIVTFPVRQSFVFIGLMKYFITYVFNLYHGLTTKHPKIKEQEFNQALFLRRFWKTRSQAQIEFQQIEIIPQVPKSFQSSAASQEVLLVSMDNNLNIKTSLQFSSILVKSPLNMSPGLDDNEIVFYKDLEDFDSDNINQDQNQIDEQDKQANSVQELPQVNGISRNLTNKKSKQD